MPRTAAVAPQVIARIRTLSPKPIHTIINTHVIAITPAATIRWSSSAAPALQQGSRHRASTVQERMIAAAAAGRAACFRLNAVITLPINNTYDTPDKDFFLNGEPS
jgi:hypothetical protein